MRTKVDRIGIETAIVRARDLPAAVIDQDWSLVSVALAPHRAHRPSLAASWDSWVIVAVQRGAFVGVLPIQRPKNTAVSGSVLDPVSVAPEIFGTAARDPREYLFIGGCTDLVAGTATAAGLGDVQSRRVKHALVTRAVEESHRLKLTGAALYVRDEELEAFSGGGLRQAVPIARLSSLRVPASHADYLGSLRGSQRRTVIKDRQVTAELGLRTDVLPAAETVDEAAPLIMNVKRRHDVLDHPRLARLRLAEWAADPLGDRVAFVVSGEAGPLAITFACDCGRMLEIYEIGLTDEPAHRHAAYVQSLVHAPLAYAMEHGLDEIVFGLDAEKPKTIRGAILSPVWAARAPSL